MLVCAFLHHVVLVSITQALTLSDHSYNLHIKAEYTVSTAILSLCTLLGGKKQHRPAPKHNIMLNI